MTAFVIQQVVIYFLVHTQIQAGCRDDIVSEPQKLMKANFSSADFKNVGVDAFIGPTCGLRTAVVSTSGVDKTKSVFPKCIEVKKCVGCCNDKSICCMATEKSRKNVTVMMAGGPGVNILIRVVQFVQHEKCECRPRRKGKICGGDPIAALI